MLDEEIPDWARRCRTGKIKYASAMDARKSFRAAGGRKRAANGLKGTLHAYRCRACGSFHLGTKREP